MTLVALAVLAATASAAHAKHYQDHVQVAVYAPPRVYSETNTLPIEDFERTRPPTRMRVRGHTHRLYWNNTVIGTTSTSLALKQIRRTGHSTAAVFADRPLRAAERRRYREAVPLYDEADVMVVAEGHPACGGITRAQARSIVAGRITRWSQVVSGASSDAISVRYRKAGGSEDLRFGARYVRRSSGRYTTSYPAGSRGSADGGVTAAASGDQSVAAVGAWSRLRGRSGVCAVPLGGVAPTNASVADHSYAEAFRVTYVVPRRRIRFGVSRKAARLVEKFMASAAAKSALARRGLLVVGGAPPTAGPGAPADVAAPTTDHAGRPITTTPAAGAEQSLTGLLLDSPATAEGHHRLVFEPDGALRQLTFDASGACMGESSGGWTIMGGWRYAEHGGGLIARLGWFLGDPNRERVIDLPDAEPQAAYLNGAPYARATAGPSSCAP